MRLAAEACFSLRGKVVVYEAALYCVALAASLFFAVLELSGWGAKKMERAVGHEEHQEETSL